MVEVAVVEVEVVVVEVVVVVAVVVEAEWRMEAAWRPAEHLAVLQADDEALAAGGAAQHLGVADGGVELPLALALAAGGVEAQLLVVA